MDDIGKEQGLPPLWAISCKAADLLVSDPAEAERRASALLRSAPAEPHVLGLLVGAIRAQGETNRARAALEDMTQEHAKLAALHYELGLLYASLNERGMAIASLSRVVELEPEHPTCWRVLADEKAAAGDAEGAAQAYARHFQSALCDVLVLEQVMKLDADQIQNAATVLGEFLNIHPTDANALHLMATLHMRVERLADAERVLAKALDVAPEFVAARRDYGVVLKRQSKWDKENENLDVLLANDPENTGYRYLKATVLFRLGRLQESIEFSEALLREDPHNPDYRLAYAHALRMIGRTDECIAAFRKVIELDPSRGDAWWGLANLKTFRFTEVEIETMRAQISRKDLSVGQTIQLHFALGKGLEDRGAYGDSFAHYDAGNAAVAARNTSNLAEISKRIEYLKTQYTPQFFRDIAGKGCPSPDPIFIISLPRSGSTLVEQILSSHSAVEGAGEINALPSVLIGLEDRARPGTRPTEGGHVALLAGEDARSLGEEYLDHARKFRKLGSPFFTDKMPINWVHAGLISAILPNAKIVEVRRDPLACCFSNYKQLFPSLTGPMYNLEELGRYYRGYLDLMAHYDAVLPGRVHRVVYEDLVRDPETEIRGLLDYCGLPFEENCLRFYQSNRPVITSSSEQVRRPIYSDSLDQWRHFEPWLAPLKDALGPAVHEYRRTTVPPDNAGSPV